MHCKFFKIRVSFGFFLVESFLFLFFLLKKVDLQLLSIPLQASLVALQAPSNCATKY